jgi:hypothetical protein
MHQAIASSDIMEMAATTRSSRPSSGSSDITDGYPMSSFFYIKNKCFGAEKSILLTKANTTNTEFITISSKNDWSYLYNS